MPVLSPNDSTHDIKPFVKFSIARLASYTKLIAIRSYSYYLLLKCCY